MAAFRWRILGLATTFLAASSIIAAPSRAASEGPRVGLEHSSNDPGGDVYIGIFVDKIPPPGLGAWRLLVDYDSSAIRATQCDAALADTLQFCQWEDPAQGIRLVGASSSGIEGSATLAGIVFQCSDRNRIVEADLHLTVQTFADATFADPQPISAEESDGRVSCVPEYPRTLSPGDVNCDDGIDSEDAALTLQYTIALTDRVLCLLNMDVDNNSYFNSIDAALILQFSAGLIGEF